MVGGAWAHRPHQPMPCGVARCPTWPTMSLIRVICKVAPLGVITTLDPCRFDPRMDVELPWITGSTVIHLEDQNRPPNHLTSWETKLPTMQLPSRGHPSPLDGEAVQWTVDRPCPKSTNAPLSLHRLTHSYKYPPPSTHYKRGYGAWWRSPLSSSQAFQVFQALRSSPRVVA